MDEEILGFLGGRSLSPRDLSRGCQSKGISRATYFRHKNKLIKQMKIEEVMTANEEGKTVKKLRCINPGELAEARDIELYVDEMNSPVEETRKRGYHFFKNLCGRKRSTWFFSSKFSPRFKNEQGIKQFFEQKLTERDIDSRLQFMDALDFMIGLEPDGSIWKENIFRCCEDVIQKLVWERKDIKIGTRAFQILQHFPGKPLENIAIDILVRSNDTEFQHFIKDLKSVLIDSALAVKKKHIIRRQLDNLSAQNPQLRPRVEELLKGARP